MNLEEKIIAFASLPSVSGRESAAKESLEKLMSGFDQTQTDALGNRICLRRCGREGAPRILLDAHFDEIGMYVCGIEEGGFLKLAPIGGLDRRTLSSAPVVIYGEKTISGILSSTPPHLAAKDGKAVLPELGDLLVDTGYSKEELEKIAPIGTPVGFAPRFRHLAGKRLTGKSFDNKACCAIAAEALLSTPREELAGDVYLLFSVREETGAFGGVSSAALSVNPDRAMVLDADLAAMPGTKEADTVKLGGGPSLTRGPVLDKRLRRSLEARAAAAGIPVQPIALPNSTGTNAPAVNLTGAGIPTVNAGLPVRVMHTYHEILDLTDAENLRELVRLFITDKEVCG